MDADAMVFVVDDDAPMRESLKNLMRSVGLRVEAFASAQEFLRSTRPDVPGCLVLDVRLPGLSGLDLQQRLAEIDMAIPIIFITGHGDIPMTVQAMKSGAVEFLTKPCRHQDLLDAVRRALVEHRSHFDEAKQIAAIRSNFAALTAREKEIIAFVTAGLMNKQIAAQLGINEGTVKMHRGNIMRKMRARSLAELVRMADILGIGAEKSATN